MDKMQVEEMHDFLSQKITYEEISAIQLVIYPSVRGYSVKSTKRFCNKMELPQDLSRPCANNDFESSCRVSKEVHLDAKFAFLSNRVYNFVSIFKYY